MNDLFIGILLSVLLGALVGAQREIKQQRDNKKQFAGFRTFTFISILGFLLGFISIEILDSFILIFIGFFGIFLLVTTSYIFYVLGTNIKNRNSIIGEVSAIITFIVGLLISLKYYYFSIFLTILITTILFLGNGLHNFAKKIKENEVFGTLKFAIISFVILPILPNKFYGPLDFPYISDFFLKFFSAQILLEFKIFNFFQIWLMVVLISAITYIGYILMKTIGTNKGILLTGFLGGLMSSTAVASSFAIESKRSPSLKIPLAVGIIIASSTMFFRVILEVALINPLLLSGVIFLSLLGIIGFVYGFYLFFGHISKKGSYFEMSSPFTLGPAIKFGLFFLVIILFSKVFTLLLGNYGIYFIAFFSGFVDVDVIVLTFSQMALKGEIMSNVAILGIFIATISNTFFKFLIVYFLGTREIANKIFFAFLSMTMFGLVLLFFI